MTPSPLHSGVICYGHSHTETRNMVFERLNRTGKARAPFGRFLTRFCQIATYGKIQQKMLRRC